VFILIAMICVLSQLDEYVITPMVHSRNLNMSPLWSLFSIFCASTLFGFGGFVIAIPCYLVIRVIIRKRMEYEAMNEPKYKKEDV
jgi:predicted PurR-regulated permease PerM